MTTTSKHLTFHPNLGVLLAFPRSLLGAHYFPRRSFHGDLHAGVYFDRFYGFIWSEDFICSKL